MKHTPGPWIVQICRDRLDVISTRNYGRIVPNVCYLLKEDEIDLANANLIAAAPELLAALAACHDVLLMDPKYESGRAISMANRAIARALGELK